MLKRLLHSPRGAMHETSDINCENDWFLVSCIAPRGAMHDTLPQKRTIQLVDYVFSEVSKCFLVHENFNETKKIGKSLMN